MAAPPGNQALAADVTIKSWSGPQFNGPSGARAPSLLCQSKEEGRDSNVGVVVLCQHSTFPIIAAVNMVGERM